VNVAVPKNSDASRFPVFASNLSTTLVATF
jgi:hypothetical protein